jgi:hypothetical protein
MEPQPLNPAEELIGEDKIPQLDRTVVDFWQWAYSDLVSNTDRGILAEYIVAIALGIDDTVRAPWGPYDLLTPAGTKIEVKSGSYIQSWNQSEHSKIQFSIKKTLEWRPATNSFGGEKKRQSDIYVFCHLSHQTKEDINPLDLKQWDFYVIPTNTLDIEMKDAVSISLTRVKKFSEKYPFSQLESACGKVC